jgi:hypothetical protein
MATPTPPAAETSVKPPDERFWVKYSPHHELPISSLASVAWHLFGLVLIVLVAFVVSYARNDDMLIETVGLAGGGGGNPLGVGQAPGSGSTGGLVDATKPREQLKDARPTDKTNADAPLTVLPTDIFKGLTDDPEAQREIAKIAERGTDALDQLNKLDKNLRDALAAGKGKGGPGSGGGQGKGDGPGDGDGSGIGGKLSQTAKRRLKWTISFSTSGGIDYLRQLNALGGMLAIAVPPENEIKFVKNVMNRPVRWEKEDLARLMRERIYWIDDKPDSVQQLAMGLGLNFVPERVGAFFPKELENTLLQKELAYQHKREEQIRETRFQVIMRGLRQYDIIVIHQVLW